MRFRFIAPKDPFAARSKMDIAYTSGLHRDLYTPVRSNMPEQNEHLGNAFLERYPQFEPLRAEWLASRPCLTGYPRLPMMPFPI
ncbi:hypothetical protein RLO149_c044370 [Roseobacter litoralis Och 149]|uniref:Uncharacterized protein n=1 Tax=Roseobacter litoralis (strain ATCC 49566 / DSM 6996 / JCM 21268 / NBRC 15278 / OCh 149) TaxID=391595 RepID=F7ZJ79_ROSLO|nr:hypothetical protein RLO149_c044370 [Roseobacter litoralis Och 149]